MKHSNFQTNDNQPIFDTSISSQGKNICDDQYFDINNLPFVIKEDKTNNQKQCFWKVKPMVTLMMSA